MGDSTPWCAHGFHPFPALVEWLTQPELIPFLVALGFATAFVHYLLDRALYRFSDPAVRSAARGLVDPPPGRPAG